MPIDVKKYESEIDRELRLETGLGVNPEKAEEKNVSLGFGEDLYLNNSWLFTYRVLARASLSEQSPNSFGGSLGLRYDMHRLLDIGAEPRVSVTMHSPQEMPEVSAALYLHLGPVSPYAELNTNELMGQRPSIFTGLSINFDRIPKYASSLERDVSPSMTDSENSLAAIGLPGNNDFIQMLRMAKEKGFKFKVKKRPMDILLVRSNAPESERLMNDLAYNSRGVSNGLNHIDGRMYPSGPVSFNYELRQRIFNGFNADDAITIHPFIAYLDENNGNWNLFVVNAITDKTIFKKTYSRLPSSDQLTQDVSLNIDWKKVEANLENLPEATDAERKKWEEFIAFKNIALENNEEVTKQIREEWKNGENIVITVELIPNHFEYDRGSSRRGESVTLRIDKKFMEQNNYQPIALNGRIVDVTLNRDDTMICTGSEIIPKGEHSNCVCYIPNTQTLSNKGGWKAVKVDLSEYGLPIFANTLYYKTVAPAGEIRGYLLYDQSLENLSEKYPEKLEALVRGIITVETLFNTQSTAVVKALNIVDTVSTNLTVEFKKRDTINIFDEALKGLSIDQFECFGRHEALHSFDMKHKISESPEFKSHFDKIKTHQPNFFKFINEKNIYSASFGGHSEDNVLEYFASLINSTYSPHLSNKLQSTSSQNRKYYYESLINVRDVLISKFGQDLGLIHHLNKIIQEVETLAA